MKPYVCVYTMLVLSLCHVPVEGQCTVNIQGSMFGMCAVSGTDA